MRLLMKKMMRDIRRSIGAYVICMFVISVGFCGYASMSIARDNIVSARDEFYKAQNFGDGFASVKKAPKSLERRLSALPGVKEVSGRIVKEARLISFTGEKAELKLVSLEGSGVNDVKTAAGRLPYESEKAICTSTKFFNARNLKIADTLRFSVEGRQVGLTVVGHGQSPEFIYVLKSLQDLLPDPSLYEIGYVDYDLMSALFNMGGLANDFAFTMYDGYNFSDIKSEVEKILEPYGVISVYGSDKQLSNSVLSEDLKQLDSSITTIPLLFLSISSIILYIMLKRLIEQQRTQIGVFKALGYSTMSIVAHFVMYGAIVGLVGGCAGGALGSYLARPMTELYKAYYTFPNLEGRFSVKYLFLGIAISTFISAFAAYRASRGVLTLSPSEALRPWTPMFKGTTPIEKVPFIYGMFTTQGRMAVRNIFRNAKRSVLTTIGLVSAFTLMASLLSMYSLYDVFIFDYYTKMQKQDIRIGFSNPVLVSDAIREGGLSSIELAEPIMETGATLRYGTKSEDSAIIAIKPGAKLYLLFDEAGNRIAPSQDGIVISTHLSSVLDAQIGDMLEIEFTYPKKRTERVRVDAIASQYLGSNAYMSYNALSRISDYNNAATSMYVKGGQKSLESLEERLSDAGAVSVIEDRMETITKYRTLLNSYNYIIYVMAVLGVVTGFAVIYTSSLITFEELKKEMATLKVLGLGPRESLEVISVEHWIIAAASVIIGIPLTILTGKGMAAAMSSTLYSIPDIVDPASMLQSAVGTAVAVLIANRVIYLKIVRIVPADIVKERE